MKTELFLESRELDGYAIALRNDWNYHIEREFISAEDKERYLREFGEQIITRNQFFDWWCQIHHCQTNAQQ